VGLPIAPGAHVEVRDAVWRVVRVTPTFTGTHARHVVGVSLVHDHEARLARVEHGDVGLEVVEEDRLVALDPDVPVLDPRETRLVALDAGPGR
jgi:hypothetical protein